MVLLIVDVQKAITNDALYRFELFRSRLAELIGRARRRGVEVIFVRHDDGPGSALTKGQDGFEIHEDFCPAIGELVLDKTVNSAFRDTGLTEYLREKREDTVMIAGLQTDYCIDATIKAGFERGFKMIVPEETNSTFGNRYMSGAQTYEYYNSFIWNGRYAECISFEDALARVGG